jgi:hypothetical protein
MTCASCVLATPRIQRYKFWVKTCSPETLVSTYNLARCRNLEDHNLNLQFMFSLRATDQVSHTSMHDNQLMHRKFKRKRWLWLYAPLHTRILSNLISNLMVRWHCDLTLLYSAMRRQIIRYIVNNILRTPVASILKPADRNSRLLRNGGN